MRIFRQIATSTPAGRGPRPHPAPARPAPREAANGGFCPRCGATHLLPWEPAWPACLDLMDQLEDLGRIDFALPPEEADPRLRTAPLFAPGSGKMLGLLLARDAAGDIRRLLAFSGMFGGLWRAPGWADPLFDAAAFQALHAPVAARLKELGEALAPLPKDSPQRQALRREQRALSRENTRALQSLYRVGDFRGETRPLASFFPEGSGPPTGTGDCCAPKLLRAAQVRGLRPLAMAEFFWGAPGGARRNRHREHALPCPEKCGPILGFMLCGC